MQGKRWDNPNSDMPEPGTYGKGADGAWFGCPPQILDDDGFPLVANLSAHQVEEHEDGTITVSPSILISASHRRKLWHGFLEKGIWREA